MWCGLHAGDNLVTRMLLMELYINDSKIKEKVVYFLKNPSAFTDRKGTKKDL